MHDAGNVVAYSFSFSIGYGTQFVRVRHGHASTDEVTIAFAASTASTVSCGSHGDIQSVTVSIKWEVLPSGVSLLFRDRLGRCLPGVGTQLWDTYRHRPRPSQLYSYTLIVSFVNVLGGGGYD